MAAKKAKAKAKPKAKAITAEDMVNTMLDIVDSVGDLKASIRVEKKGIVQSIPIERGNAGTLKGFPKSILQETYNSLIELKTKTAI